jgi:hypothetical protein
MPARIFPGAALLATCLLTTLAPPRPARACGGFFCNGGGSVGSGPATVIVQGGERVVFAQGEDGVTMHVEVRYEGDPTKFGWLLPVPRPTPAAIRTGARPFTLEALLSVSARDLFDTLQTATDPRYDLVDGGVGANLCSSDSGCGSGCAVEDMATLNTRDDLTGTPGKPTVWVSDQALIGPYEAQLIEATEADDLYAWLEASGFYQDPAARPLLQHYIDDNWGFIALRLQSGQTTGDLRPIALHVSEGSPCVPLRLTAIAATDDMPILVWVLGAHRAVPKNFLSAVINDASLTFPGAPEYLDRVSRAVDLAGGHAWVTEMSGPLAPIREAFGTFEIDRARFDAATTLEELLTTYSGPGTEEENDVWREEVVPPPDVPRVLFDHSPRYYLTSPGVTLVHDLATLKTRLEDDVFAPRRAIETMLSEATVVTRFLTMIDPFEMTRDPVFAFNPELPPVSNNHSVTLARVTDKSCSQTWRATYADGRVVERVPVTINTNPAGGQTALLSALADESPLSAVELLDEEGPARPFDPAQAADVDALLDDAELGLPSLPAKFVLRAPPVDREDSGCSLSLPGAFVLLPLAFLVAHARRLRRREALAQGSTSKR